MIIKNLYPDKKEFNVIGIMSGTSLDGLDICHTIFQLIEENWTFEIKNAETFHYQKDLKEKLAKSRFLSGLELTELDLEIGREIGKKTNFFIEKYGLSNLDFVASHGHTVFHQPEKGFTLQIGNGEAISQIVNLPVINDFRQKDIQLGGQGAPLVPIGDLLLFKDYDACLNLGGIANISMKSKEEIKAFDICPMNLSLNYIASKLQLDYDPEGINASKGQIIESLFQNLEKLSFYESEGPKSLGIEWLDQEIFNRIDNSSYSESDLLRTFVEHQTNQIAKVINQNNCKRVLITGGGTWNSFFIKTLDSKTETELILPESKIIEYKEALIFAFLGVLYAKGIPNILSSVTGSSRNSVSGVLHLPY